MTNLERLQSTGIRRIGTPKRGFHYHRLNGGGQVTREDLARIKRLVIPPAWTDVAINSAANGRVQVVGKDAAGRWQYMYHENHTRIQEAKKFRRLTKFAQALPILRKAIRKDLQEPGLSRNRVLACVLRILSSCSMRPGSEVYANENGSYGIATLHSRHIKVKGDTVYFDFPGKSGVRQQRQLKDKKVAEVVRSLLRKPGKRVFQYENGNSELVRITSRHINEYIKEVMGDHFSAKDFRTWAGTLICASALGRIGVDNDDSRSARNRRIVAAIKETAGALGNTPAVCRKSYICPAVVTAYEKGQVVSKYFPGLDSFLRYRGSQLHPAEKSLVRFLKQIGSC